MGLRRAVPKRLAGCGAVRCRIRGRGSRLCACRTMADKGPPVQKQKLKLPHRAAVIAATEAEAKADAAAVTATGTAATLPVAAAAALRGGRAAAPRAALLAASSQSDPDLLLLACALADPAVIGVDGEVARLAAAGVELRQTIGAAQNALCTDREAAVLLDSARVSRCAGVLRKCCEQVIAARDGEAKAVRRLARFRQEKFELSEQLADVVKQNRSQELKYDEERRCALTQIERLVGRSDQQSAEKRAELHVRWIGERAAERPRDSNADGHWCDEWVKHMNILPREMSGTARFHALRNLTEQITKMADCELRSPSGPTATRTSR
jgi:hypothetical protein